MSDLIERKAALDVLDYVRFKTENERRFARTLIELIKPASCHECQHRDTYTDDEED